METKPPVGFVSLSVSCVLLLAASATRLVALEPITRGTTMKANAFKMILLSTATVLLIGCNQSSTPSAPPPAPAAAPAPAEPAPPPAPAEPAPAPAPAPTPYPPFAN